MKPCMKVIGADFELSNSLDSGGSRDGNPAEATRRLLAEIAGFPRTHWWGGPAVEWGRRFLSGNGGSAYDDSSHLELNTPEHSRAEDHPAIMHACLRIAREAQVAATAQLRPGSRLHVLANVSDGQQSWGHHLNIALRRDVFDDLFHRKPHVAGFLATHLATAPLYAGQGMVGPGNERSWCDFQLSQRADWFEQLVSLDTMQRRGLLNLRDEAHAGAGLARLHLIPFDLVLCPMANYLMAGTTQLVAALAEAGWADPRLQLDDPLDAFHEVSRDLSLQKPLAMAQRGRSWTAVEVQRGLVDLAAECVASGELGDAVPGAAALVACWRETLDLLARRDLAALARRCDWALKYLLLDRQRGRRGLSWRSPELKYLDLQYASLDPQEGLFWQMAAAGQVEAMPAPERVEHFFHNPPDDTRAYLRAHVLRRFGEHVVSMDWDRIRFRVQTDRYWSSESTLTMPDPAGFGRAASEAILGRCESLRELIEALGSDGQQATATCEEPWRSEASRQREDPHDRPRRLPRSFRW